MYVVVATDFWRLHGKMYFGLCVVGEIGRKLSGFTGFYLVWVFLFGVSVVISFSIRLRLR
jgi:hypothetical protein